jgi:dimethylaniline monooxygenase (N-oxide forming)
MITELFAPYKPEDFNGIIDEYYAQKRIKSTTKAHIAESQFSRLLALCLAGAGTFIVLIRWISSMI